MLFRTAKNENLRVKGTSMYRSSIFPLIVAISLVSGCGYDGDRSSSQIFPARNAIRLELPEEDEQIDFRFVNWAEDGSHVRTIVTEFKDGITETKYFRPDSTLDKVTQFYPTESQEQDVGDANNTNKTRQLRISLVYDENGKVLLYERAFQPDGKAAVFGSRGADGNFRRELFYENGKSLHRLHFIDPSGLVLMEQIFGRDGIIELVIRRDKRGNEATEEYREDGTLCYVTVRPRSKYGPVERSFYSTDGARLEMQVRYASGSIQVKYYVSGKVVEERYVYQSGTASVTTWDSTGNKITRRYSGKPDSNDWTDITGFELKGVTEYDGDSKVRREIEFHPDGKTPREVRYPDGPGTTYKTLYKYFREDGTLEKEEYKEDYKTTRDEKEYPAEDEIRETVPEEYFTPSDRSSPELLSASEMPEPPQYGCENCCGEGCEYCMP